MPMRLNYTNRKKLKATEANVTAHTDAQKHVSFQMFLNLDALRPQADDARVFVEAYYQSTRVRFDCGTVAHPDLPTLGPEQLAEFDAPDLIRFRVKVTDVTQSHGRLIAWRDSFKPAGLNDHPDQDLLHFVEAVLDGPMWSLEFDDGLGPIVSIDRNAGTPHEVGCDDRFRAAVYPEILRRVLIEAFIENKENNGDDEEHWSYDWLHGFLKPQLHMGDLPELDGENFEDRQEWIDDAVRRFARRHDLTRLWNKSTQESTHAA